MVKRAVGEDDVEGLEPPGELRADVRAEELPAIPEACLCAGDVVGARIEAGIVRARGKVFQNVSRPAADVEDPGALGRADVFPGVNGAGVSAEEVGEARVDPRVSED